MLLLFGSALGSGTTLAFRDTDRLYAPIRTIVDDALRSGSLPLWNPYECMGKPLFAEGIHGVLNPISVAGAWLFPHDVDFLAVSYLLAAALGAFALARAIGASRTASSAAGLCYGLSGYVLSMTGNLVFLAGAAALPWIPAAARIAGGGAPLGPLATALATAIALLSGDTQSAIVGVALGLALAWAAGGFRGAARALLGASIGVLLAGLQVMASAAALVDATRAYGLPATELEQWPLHPARMLEWIVPGLIRGELPLARIPEVISQGQLPGSFAESVYLGAPAILLAGVGLWRARTAAGGRRTAIVLAAALAALVWIALGHRLGARQVLDAVPIWNRFRYTEKMMVSIALCVATAAAIGIDGLAAARLPRGAVAAAMACATAATFAYGLVVFAPGTVRALFASLDDEAAAFLLQNLVRGLLHPAAFLAAVLIVDRLRGPATPALLAVTAAGAVALASPYAAHLGLQAPHETRTPFRLDAPPPGPRIAHALDRTLAPTASLDAVATNAILTRTILVPSANVAERVDNMDCYGAFLSARRGAVANDVGEWLIQLARRFGLTHVVLVPPENHAQSVMAGAAIVGGELAESLDDPPVEVWKVPHRPWTFFARSVLEVPSTAAARRVFEKLSARGDTDTVVVEATQPVGTAPGTILSVARGVEDVRIEAESSGPAVLVVSDAYWSGWRAFIDGEETEIVAADVLARAVRWPAGRHTLVMRYEPRELRAGAVATACGALAALALGAWGLLEVRRRRRAATRRDPPARC